MTTRTTTVLASRLFNRSNMSRFAAAAAVATSVLLAGTATAQDAKPSAPPPAGAPIVPATATANAEMTFVVLKTSKGDIVLELNTAKAPISVANFVDYVKSGQYDGTVFHRVIPSFMVQGGGFTAAGDQKKTKPSIQNEWKNGLKNMRGTIAMARTNDPNSATAQFFINHKDNPNLDQPISGGAGYAVFGQVVAGMDIVDAIAAEKTTVKRGMPNWPVADVTITKAEVLTKDDAMKAADAEKAKKATPTAPATPAAPTTPSTPAAPAAPTTPATPKN
jgi:cyclophilin family peptidyl-prolyl cis-trans isomerase